MRELRSTGPLPRRTRMALAARSVRYYLSVRLAVRRRPLPALASQIAETPRRRQQQLPARQLGWAVDRTLRVGSHRDRCIFNALVLYRLLREQGDQAELVIGLPSSPVSKDAHAWVELDGVDVGPPPGRAGHEAMARFA